MQNTNRNLIVGATGFLGGEIVRQLRQAGRAVRVLVRPSAEPAKRKLLADMETEVAEGDLKDKASLERLCAGVQTVISTASSTLSRQPGDTLQSVDRDGHLALIDAAEAAGARHFVFISVPDVESGYALLRIKREIEARLKNSRMSWSILRPVNFMEAWLSPLLGFDPAQGSARVLGTGDQPVSWVSLHDVARFAVAAAEGDRLVNFTLNLGGPEALSYHQVLEIYRKLGCPAAQVQYVPEEALEAQVRDAQTPLDEAYAAIMLATARGLVVAPDEALKILPGKLTTVREHASHMLEADHSTSEENH